MTSPADVVSAVAPPVDDLFTLRGAISLACRLIADDAYAGSFETMGEYRKALLRGLIVIEGNARSGPAGATAETPPKDQP